MKKKTAITASTVITDSEWGYSAQRHESKLEREHDFCDGKR